jgi:hypothetical protein
MSIQLQETTVQEVASLAPLGWNKIVVNIEIDEVDGELLVSPEGLYFVGNDVHELRLGIDATDCFEELRESMADKDCLNRFWTICILEILSDGAFDFKFSYDIPPRLSALHD